MPKPTIDIPLDETEEKARPTQEQKASRIDIPLDAMTVEECADAICHAFSGEK